VLKYNKISFIKTLGILASTSALLVGNASAATFNQTGTISVLPAITVSQTAQLDFGSVAIPAAGTETVIVTIDNTTGSGTATFLNSTVADGEFNITGSTTNTVNISATGTDASGIVWSAITGNYSGGAIADLTATTATLAAPGVGSVLKVGATITVASTMTAGTYSPAYALDISYD